MYLLAGGAANPKIGLRITINPFIRQKKILLSFDFGKVNNG